MLSQWSDWMVCFGPLFGALVQLHVLSRPLPHSTASRRLIVILSFLQTGSGRDALSLGTSLTRDGADGAQSLPILARTPLTLSSANLSMIT